MITILRPLSLLDKATRRLLCYLSGHTYDYGYATDFNQARCDRCCRVEPKVSAVARLVYRIKCRWKWNVRVPLEKCEYCGLRFKRHKADCTSGECPF